MVYKKFTLALILVTLMHSYLHAEEIREFD